MLGKPKSASVNTRKAGQFRDDYWLRFGLTCDPFSTRQNAALTLLLSKWEHHLDLLQHLIHTENVILAILGSKGSGKSTLLEQLSAQLHDTMLFKPVVATPAFNLKQLLHNLQSCFNLPGIESDIVEEQLDGYITSLQYQERICVLAIDDADELPEETLTGLLYVIKQQSKTQMRLHIILFGNQELQRKLAKLARQELSSDLIHSIELEPLTLEETRQYLQYRLTVAGFKKATPFTTVAIEEIHQQSNGNPLQINNLAKQVLFERLAEYETPKQHKLPNQRNNKIVGAALLVAMLGGVVYLLDHQATQNNPYLQSAPAVIAKKQIAPDLSKQPKLVAQNVIAKPVQLAQTQVSQLVTSTTSTDHNTDVQHVPTPLPAAQSIPPLVATKPAASVPATPATPAPQVATVPPAASTPQQTVQQTVTLNQPANSSVVSAPLSNSDDRRHIESGATQQNKAIAETVKPFADNPISDEQNTPTAQTNTPDMIQSSSSIASAEQAMLLPNSKNQEQMHQTNRRPDAGKTTDNLLKAKGKVAHSLQIKKVKHATAVADATKETKAVLPANEQLFARVGNHYTLQIIALTHQDALKGFISSKGLGDKAHYFVTERTGKPWYVLIYGDYPNRTEAMNAAKSLPKDIQGQVWARSIANIQKEVSSK